MLDAFQILQPRLRQCVYARTVAQQRDVSQRWQTISLFTASHIRDGCYDIPLDVLGRHEDVTIMPAGDAFGGVEPQQFAPRDAIQYAPKLAVRIDTNVGRSCFALWPPVEVET